MASTIRSLLSLQAVATLLLSGAAVADTLVSDKVFNADPSPHVFGGKLYLYATDDQGNSGEYWDSTSWRLFTSRDAETWEDQGTFLSADVFKWADKNAKAWAPNAIERNGKYYFYAPVGGTQIGVAVSDVPGSGFSDPIDKPLVETPRDANAGDEPIDPFVFIDKDQKAYMYFGTRVPKVVELGKDMTSLAGPIEDVEIKGLPEGTGYGEAPYLHQYQGQYYFTFSTGWPGRIVYATGDHPRGPFTYRGVILDFLEISTNHQAIVDFEGKTLFFYHDNRLPGGGSFKRSIAVTELKYDKDGNILPVAINGCGHATSDECWRK